MPHLASRLRDRIARFMISQAEPQREALKLVTRDRSLPLMVRIKAQLELQKFPRYTRPASLRSKCIESGKTRVNSAILYMSDVDSIVDTLVLFLIRVFLLPSVSAELSFEPWHLPVSCLELRNRYFNVCVL
jgi:hypothetical protein